MIKPECASISFYKFHFYAGRLLSVKFSDFRGFPVRRHPFPFFKAGEPPATLKNLISGVESHFPALLFKNSG